MDKNAMTLEFRVNKQHLDRIDKQKIVEKSENYLWAHFTFSSDWNGLTKYMLARPLTSQGTSEDYKLILDESGKCKIPFDLNVFPGFIISAYGVKEDDNIKITTDSLGVDDNLNIMSNVVITTDAQSVDINSVTITSGEEALAVRYVTSNNKTIIVNKYQDILDLGIETEFEYDESTYTLYLYAITYESGEKIRTLLSSIELTAGLESVTTELEYEDPTTHKTSYRNLVFTFSDGSVQRVTLDYFWDEIRQDLDTAVTNINLRIDDEVNTLNGRIDDEVNTLNTRIDNEVDTINGRIDREVETLNDTIDALDEELTEAINQERQDRINDVNAEETRAKGVEDDLQTQIVVEQQRAIGAEEDLTSALQQEATTRAQEDTLIRNSLQDEVDRATTQETILDAKIDGVIEDIGTQEDQTTGTVYGYVNVNVANINQSIQDETTRAQGVEGEIIESIGTTEDLSSDDTVYGHIKAEQERAEEAEKDISDALDDFAQDLADFIGDQSDQTEDTLFGYINVHDNALSQDIQDEETARERADSELEEQLSSDIQEEQDRATTQEIILDAKIDGLSDDLNTKSTELGTRITNETNRATQQENAITGNLNAHTSNVSNPHNVTKAQVGLGSVVNTGDSNTPVENGTTKFTTGGAYTLQQTLEGEITTLETNTNNKINVNVHVEGSSDEISYSGDIVTKTSPYQNLNTGVTGSRSEVIHLANSTTAGLMSFTDYNTIQDNKRRIDALEGTPVRLIYTASQNPTASDIKTFVDTYLASKGVVAPTDSDYNSVSVKINGTNHIWNYYANDSAYRDDGLDTVTQFTNNIAGIIKGKQQDGFVYAESDGTGSIYGWSTLKSRVTDVENNKVNNTTLGAQSDTGTSTTYGYINTQDANLQNQINNEATARTNKDNDLQNQIDDETTRALVSEAVLSGDIDDYSFKNISSQGITSIIATAKNNVWTSNN